MLVVKKNKLKKNSSTILIHNDIQIVIINYNNKYYALNNNCPHRGGSLGDGTCTDGIIVCPLHKWEFNIHNGNCIKNNKIFVKKYIIEEDKENIKIVL